MITLILIFIFEICFFLLGYWIGRQSSGNPIKLDGKELSFTQIGDKWIASPKEIPTGAITPKTPQEKAFQKLPDKVKEGIQAMKETLDADPSMQEHKRLVEQANKKL